MSLEYIPFQPLYFGELPEDCTNGCDYGTDTDPCRGIHGVGGTYANLAQYNDITQFQLALGLCEGSEQLVDNPNFEGAQSEQLVEDPTFENGLAEFTVGGGAWVAGTNQISCTSATGEASWTIPVGDTDQLRIRITITAIDGTLSLLTNGIQSQFNTTGTHEVFVNALGAADITLTYSGNGDPMTLSLFEVYTLPSMPDWITTGATLFENGIATAIGSPASTIVQTGTLAANTTYLVEVNVTDVEGDNAALVFQINQVLFVPTGIQITETGVQQFVITTPGTTPFIGVVAYDSSSISVQYIKVYEWFEPEDITVEVIPYGSTTPIYTLTDGKYIDVASLTVTLDWDEIVVEDDYLPEGLYYIKVTDCDNSIASQPIDLATSHSCTFALRACMDNDAFGFDFTAFTPFIRLRATFAQPEYNNSDRLRFIDTRDRVTNAHSVISKVKTFETEDVPEYVQDFLGTLSGYSTVWLGNSPYSIEDTSIKPEPNQEFLSWGSVQLSFRMVNHPLRMTRCVSDVKDCSPPPNCWQWNDEGNIDWNDPQECILLNN